MSRLRLALIGAGTFVRKAHAPAYAALQEQCQVVAVCSRSHESAAAVAALLPEAVTIYDHIPSLLAMEKLDAVDIVLPIPLLPEVTALALAAGVHVMSEKPIAPTLAEARPLLDLHSKRPGQVWMVAENWRYEEAFVAAGRAIREGVIGRPLTCDFALQLPVMPDTPNYRTVWRRSGGFPGGFLLDGGVHHVAGLRLVLGEIEAVGAVVAQQREDLPPADTLAAWLRFANGVIGSYTVTYAGGSPLGDNGLHVVGSAGSLRVTTQKLLIQRGTERREESFGLPFSTHREIAAFVESARTGAPHRNTPQEALADLAVVEALLAAGEKGREVQVSER
ncbi:MAG: Gfo/Idh/MocA family oxidoreductase [Caldilineaceae bacterium]|nr:Gfo/Idh/MocA family oxidoreductase [Caldilineaceae bacterium]HRJ45554.1 Gfo/Idh/MocA family oxidoreductase [Caldilineaceae bacterium]